MKYSLILSAAMIGCVSPAFAQESDQSGDGASRDKVVVTGSRLDQSLTEVGSTVDIITADDIELLGLGFALDALAKSPSVTANQSGKFGGNASVRIRGASSGQTLVLIDGVPMGDASTTDGQFDFARLDASSIESIEILKGPQSTLWGSDAVGGVVSIATKRAEDGVGGRLFGEVGSYNTVRGGGAFEYGGERADLRLFATATNTDGFSKADEANGNTEDDGYESVSYGARGGVDLSGLVRLDGGLFYTDAEAEYDGFAPGAQGSVGDADEVSLTEELSGHARLSFPLLTDKLENELFVGYTNIDRESLSSGLSSFSSQGARWQYRYKGALTINESNKLAVGVEREEATADLATGEESRTIDSLFGLYEMSPTSAVTLTAGVRVDDHDVWGSQTTGRLAAAWNPSDLVTFRASWGQGFKAPSVFQSTYICTFCGLTAPNPDLKPEEAEAYDFGVDMQTPDGKGHASITLFDTDVTNQIDFSFTAGYDNIARVQSRGVEVSASYQIADWLSLSADYAHIDAKDGNGLELVRIPDNTADVQLSIEPEGPFRGAVLIRYNGEEANSATQFVDAWTRVDLSGAYALNDRVEFFVRIENLFDKEYQQILGYGTPGLSGSGGLRLTF